MGYFGIEEYGRVGIVVTETTAQGFEVVEENGNTCFAIVFSYVEFSF